MKAWTLIETLTVLAIIGIVCVAISGGGCGGCSVSDGSRVGTVSKFSYKGMFKKSWEGELVMGGLRSRTDSDGNSQVGANIFSFSVLDADVVKKVQALQDNGHRAKLVYHQTLFRNPTKRDTCYLVVDAVDLDHPEKQ